MKRFDLGEQRIAAGIERRPIERGIAIETVEAVACQHRAEGSRHRNAALGVQTEHVVGHEAVHLAPRRAASHEGAAALAAISRRSALPPPLRPQAVPGVASQLWV